MNSSRAVAYRLDETEDGWQWRVIDGDGNTIDAGMAPDKLTARAAIRQVRRLGAAPSEASSSPDWLRLIRTFFGLVRRAR